METVSGVGDRQNVGPQFPGTSLKATCPVRVPDVAGWTLENVTRTRTEALFPGVTC